MAETSNSYESFHEALTLVQNTLPKVGKNQTADTGKFKYKYVDLETVQDAILPLLHQHGFVWVTAPTLTERGFVLHYELRHESGESITGDYHLPASDSQAIGSAITYARRYALCAVTGLAPGGDDDDGARAVASARAATGRAQEAVAKAVASVDQVVAAEWIDTIKAATTISQLQAAWEDAGKAGVTRDPKLIAAKDARKKALQ